jgi:hypothetical protein
MYIIIIIIESFSCKFKTIAYEYWIRKWNRIQTIKYIRIELIIALIKMHTTIIIIKIIKRTIIILIIIIIISIINIKKLIKLLIIFTTL